MEYWIVLLMMLLGSIAATVLPYLRKMYKAQLEGTPFKFDIVYIYNMIISTIATFISSIFIFIEWKPPDMGLSDFAIIIFAFLYGFGGNEAVKLSHQYIRLYKLKNSLLLDIS